MVKILGFHIGFVDVHFGNILDILLVTALLYNLYKLIKGGVALRIFIGFLALYLFYLVVKATEMELLTTLLGQFMNVGVIAGIILFQQEIRKFLLLIGKSTQFEQFNFWGLFKLQSDNSKNQLNITHILDAMKSMSRSKTGALIVVSKNDDLKFYAETGDIIDAVVSKRLLISVFFKNSPLHDGAAIIYKDRLLAARCILPVSDNKDIPASMGLRHRASIGLTEATNAVVLVVSEETGQMSFVKNGKIFHNLSILEIRQKLNQFLSGYTPTLNTASKEGLETQPS